MSFTISGPGSNPLGTDITEAEITLADNATNDCSTSKHGFLKKLDNNSSNFMNGAGNWAAPSTASLVLWRFPGEGTLSTTGAGLTTPGSPPLVYFTDTLNGLWTTSVVIPTGATSISSIKILYKNEANGNLALAFETGVITVPGTAAVVQVDTTQNTAAAFASAGAADNKFYFITAPSTAYNGLTVTAGNILHFYLSREGGNGIDTYNAEWNVAGIQFTFA